ncbi:MAG: hypothetical protein IT385_00175 [Deltaproteobacteria bacterium]|nr:hypothetical protein [Deltaproteobacteria bacterium]
MSPRASPLVLALVAGLAPSLVMALEVGARAEAEPLFRAHGLVRLEPVEVSPAGAPVGRDERGFAYHHTTSMSSGYVAHRLGWAAPGASEPTWLPDLWMPGDEAPRAALVSMDASSRALWILAERWSAAPDDDVLLLLRLRASEPLETVARLTRADLDIDALADFVPGETASTGYLAALGHGPTTTLAVADSGRACFIGTPGVVCVEPGPAPVMRVRLAPEALEGGGEAFAWAWRDAAPGVPAPSGWGLEALTAAPDGRLALLVDDRAHAIRVLVELAADGSTIRFADGPTRDGIGALGISTLADARQLAWAPALGAFVAWPIKDVDHVNVTYARPGGDGSGNGVEDRLGWRGRGLRIVGLAGGHATTLSLTDALARRMDCSTGLQALDIGVCGNGPGEATLVRLDGGDLGLLGVGSGGLYRIVIDPPALDLDADGLTQAEESALGTSDLARDSDGGVTSDLAEARLAGTDPADGADDPSIRGGARRDRVIYAASPEITRRGVPLPSVRSWGVDGPACDGWVCRSRDGRALATVDFAPAGTVFDEATQAYFYGFAGDQVSVDGTFLVVVRPEGLVRVFFEDGRRELYITRAELEAEPGPALLPGVTHFMDSIQYVAVDADHTWVIQPQAPARVALYQTGRPARRALDVAASRCASELGPCDPGPLPTAELFIGYHNGFPFYLPMPRADVHDAIAVQGFEAESQRLHVTVTGPLDRWRIGLHATEPPLVLARQREIMGQLMGSILPTGHGDYLVFEETRGLNGYLLGVVDALFGGRDTHVLYEPSVYPVIGVWGDTLVQSLNDRTMVELVRYDEGLEPGDLVFLAPVGEVRVFPVAPQMLYRVGPRGGVVPLWDEPVRTITRATGLDVSASGWVCIADPPGRRVHLRAPDPLRGGTPAIVADPVLSRDVIDCAWDGAALVTLHADPPRLERRAADGHALALATPALEALADPDDPARAPRQLARMPDGTIGVVRDGDAVLARALTSDGQAIVLERPADEWTPEGRLMVGERELARVAPSAGWSYDIVDRGQGQLVISAYRAREGTWGEQDETHWVHTWELATGATTSNAWWGAAHVMARVPGAPPGAFDAWTGDPIATTPGPPAPTIPTAPIAPEGGEIVATDDGCAGGPTTLPLWLAALLIGAHRRARRGQPRSFASSRA